MARSDDFDDSVPLPPGLTITAIRKSIEYIERELADLLEILRANECVQRHRGYRTTLTLSFGDITHTATFVSSSLPQRSPSLSAASAAVAERERVGFERPAGAEVAARLARRARTRRRLPLVAAAPAQRIPWRSSGRLRGDQFLRCRLLGLGGGSWWRMPRAREPLLRAPVAVGSTKQRTLFPS
jgi:hypothetical protein